MMSLNLSNFDALLQFIEILDTDLSKIWLSDKDQNSLMHFKIDCGASLICIERFCNHLCSFHLTMAIKQDWKALLKKNYPSYKVEVEAFLDSLAIATSNEISASKVYDAIKDISEVNSNLKSLYREALFGRDKDMKSCIKNRMTNFCRNLK